MKGIQKVLFNLPIYSSEECSESGCSIPPVIRFATGAFYCAGHAWQLATSSQEHMEELRIAIQIRIAVGDIVRVLARGEFYGQEKPVLKIEQDRGEKIWYQVDVVWPHPEHKRPSWFEAHEIEKVEAQS